MRILNNVGINQRRADSYFDIYLMCDAAEKDLPDYLDLRKTERFYGLYRKNSVLTSRS